MEALSILALGLLLGMQHAMEADHLAAVLAIVSGNQSVAQGVRHGIAWGLGHSLTLLAVTLVVSVFGLVISPALSAHLEHLVGVMLVLLGLHLFWRCKRQGLHIHRHHHGSYEHIHIHQHEHTQTPHTAHHQQTHEHSHRLPKRSLLVGIVHGLAGSSALILLLGHTLPNLAWALLYVTLFGLGSILGMALLSGILAWAINRTANHLSFAYKIMNIVVATVSVGLGLYLATA